MLDIPSHIAVIADGNGRWARERGLPRTAGHAMGARALNRVLLAAKEFGVKTLTGWFFSTDNFARPKPEVDYLMRLFHRFLVKQKARFIKNRVRVNVIGDRYLFSPEIQKAMAELEDATRDFDGFVFNCALGYGGQAELVRVAQTLAQRAKDGELNPADITPEIFEAETFLAGQTPPDLIIRTSGEYRLSGFFPWQSVYSELYFARFYFPDFTKARLAEAIDDYRRRDRRFGKVK